VRALTRRSILLGAMAAPFAAHAQGNAQGWPAGTIRIVVPYPPAGSTDVMARLVQVELQQRLGATIIIENRPGASGSVGTAAVAKSPPDGNSWLIVFDNHAANPFVLPNLPYDTEKDLEPVLFIGTAPYVISTHPQKPYKTLADVVAAAKAKPDAVELAACLREPRVAKQLTETQQVSLALGGPEDLRKFLGEQMQVWGAVVRENDIKSD
jgi:tripartite-type tricarboxylate transporter receptor subunit TctC